MILVVLGLAGAALAATLAFAAQGPPYVASDDASVNQMLTLLAAAPAKRVLDLGSGDGKLLIRLGQAGYRTDGVEINPWLVWRSRRAIRRAGLAGRVTVKWGNLWGYDAAPYEAVTLYAVRHAMPRLEKKLRAELKPGARVVSNYFVFPNLKPRRRLGRARIYEI